MNYPEEAPVLAGVVELRQGPRPVLVAAVEAAEIDHRNLHRARHCLVLVQTYGCLAKYLLWNACTLRSLHEKKVWH